MEEAEKTGDRGAYGRQGKDSAGKPLNRIPEGLCRSPRKMQIKIFPFAGSNTGAGAEGSAVLIGQKVAALLRHAGQKAVSFR